MSNYTQKDKNKKQRTNRTSISKKGDKGKVRKVSGEPNNVYPNTTLSNDPSWYNMYPDLVQSTAKVPTGYPIGINYRVGTLWGDDFNFVNSVHTMRFNYIHGPGTTISDRDPVNLAATKLYSFVRHANSGHSNYERSDLMLYFLAVMEVYNLIAVGVRAYGTIYLYNQYNRTLPKHTINAMGWDYDDVSSNANLLRTEINNAIARINSLYVPSELNVMKRWWWLNTNVFLDSNGPKALNYVFVPEVYRTWEEMNSEGGGYLKAHTAPETWSITEWKRALRQCLDRILDSEDIGIMSGDIMKAFGSSVFKLDFIPENYITPFVYSEEVLMQINNTTVLGYAIENVDITQETNENLNSGLRYTPYATIPDDGQRDFNMRCLTAIPVMSFDTENPDNTMVMVASRNIITCSDYDEETGKFEPNSGSEIVLTETIYSINDDGTVEKAGINPSLGHWSLGDPLMLYHYQFDWCPLVKSYNQTNNRLIVTCSHYENVIPVDDVTIDRMHDVALLSLFSALV